MARVATETIFPTLVVASGVLSINLSDLPGLTATEAAGGSSNIRDLAYALDYAIATRIAALAANARPTGMSKTLGTPTTPTSGQQSIPVTTTYVIKNELGTPVFIDEV